MLKLQPVIQSGNENVETNIFGSMQPSTDEQPETADENSKKEISGQLQGTDPTNIQVQADPFHGLQQTIPTNHSVTDPFGQFNQQYAVPILKMFLLQQKMTIPNQTHLHQFSQHLLGKMPKLTHLKEYSQQLEITTLT